jgi:hypothetical protein
MQPQQYHQTLQLRKNLLDEVRCYFSYGIRIKLKKPQTQAYVSIDGRTGNGGVERKRTGIEGVVEDRMTNGSRMDDILRARDEGHDECCICYEPMITPYVLPCNH